MQIKSFDTILSEMCDNFDSIISPKAISRSNTNIIYLLFKAIAKGLEVLNNVCVIVSNKFDPARCEVEDLNSIASLVGTEKLKGSASGLHIIITNNSDEMPLTVKILKGIYKYIFNDDVTFVFEMLEDTVIPQGGYITVIAMSENIGVYEVTAQSEIKVTSDVPIHNDLSFSCNDNSSLLGTKEETDLEFRKRVLEGYNNQDSIVELQTTLRNLPYIFDCRIKFNNTSSTITYEGISIPPFYCVIFYSGALRSEMAEVIAQRIICPTVSTSESRQLIYENEVFEGGKHIFNLIPFARKKFSVNIKYKINSLYVNEYDIKETIRKSLVQNYVAEIHIDYVKENDIYNIIEGLNLTGVEVLDVNMIVDGEEVSFVEVPLSCIPELENVNFIKLS